MTEQQQPYWLDTVQWNSQGLVPAIAQDHQTGRVLMLAWMNRESLELTLAEQRAVYWSRSRQVLWRKGEQSGNRQELIELRLDCDSDALLLRVRQIGGVACHTGRESCFFQELIGGQWVTQEAPLSAADIHPLAGQELLGSLADLLAERKGADPESSYVASLYGKGQEAILKKIGEEGAEFILAAKGGELDKVVYEAADLCFHSLVALADLGVRPEAVLAELSRRFGRSGLVEKAARSENSG